jgi:hypothetical protein
VPGKHWRHCHSLQSSTIELRCAARYLKSGRRGDQALLFLKNKTDQNNLRLIGFTISFHSPGGQLKTDCGIALSETSWIML